MNSARARSIVFILLLPAAWWLMLLVHEFGHVLGAWATGGTVERVHFRLLEISRTDLSHNPSPLLVVWAGPLGGVLIPLALWLVAAAVSIRGRHVLRFFAGFCLIANAAYLGVGSFAGIGDCGTMLHLGSPIWTLWLFGLVAFPAGLLIWHNLGREFGLKTESSTATPSDQEH